MLVSELPFLIDLIAPRVLHGIEATLPLSPSSSSFPFTRFLAASRKVLAWVVFLTILTQQCGHHKRHLSGGWSWANSRWHDVSRHDQTFKRRENEGPGSHRELRPSIWPLGCGLPLTLALVNRKGAVFRLVVTPCRNPFWLGLPWALINIRSKRRSQLHPR